MRLTCFSSVVIVTADNPTPREQFAAEELKKYLEEMLSGINVRISANASPEDMKILVGHPSRNTFAAKFITIEEIDKRIPGPEGIFLHTFDGKTLLVTGSEKDENEWERGTVYAVYELLERYCGCIFAGFTKPGVEGGEYIPELTEIDFSSVDYAKECADLEFRTAVVQYFHNTISPQHKLTVPFLDWMVKNRYNRIYTWASVYEEWKETGLLDEAVRRGFRFLAGHHDTCDLLLPLFGNSYFPEHYAETHPEFFRLQEDGTRFVSTEFYGQWIYCSRNEELIETFANNVIAWVAQNPAVDMVNISPRDGMAPGCCCEKCAKFTKHENYIYFAKSVAEKVRKKCPHIKMRITAYADMWECPDGVELPDNVVVNQSMWKDDGLRYTGKPDGSCVIGTVWEDNLLKWKATGAKVVCYEYYMGIYPAYQRWVPSADELQAIWRGHKKNGIYGACTQMECYNFWNHAFNLFCFARMGYDTSVSFDECLSLFCKIFDGGAPFVEEVIRHGEAVLDGQKKVSDAGVYVAENVDKEKLYRLYERALDSAKTVAARNNVRLMRMGWRYTDLEVQNTKLRGEGWKFEPYEKCDDPTGELYYMSKSFDSSHHNDPGYGIMFPLDCEKSDKDFSGNIWYRFE